MGKDYQYVDISRVKEAPKCAIICNTEQEVELFYHSCEEQIPELIDFWTLEDVLSIWNSRERVCFSFLVGDEIEDMSWCYEAWFIESGYEIVEFSELANPSEIEESDSPINVLLGG